MMFSSDELCVLKFILRPTEQQIGGMAEYFFAYLQY